MPGHRRLTLALALAAVCMLAVPTAAVAQDQQDNETATPERTVDEEVADQLGDLVIHSYEYDKEQEVMTIEASWQGRAPTRVTFVEMIELDSGGSQSLTFERIRLSPEDRTEIRVQAGQRAGGTAAVMVTTPESIDRGDALVLQDGDPDEYPAIRFSNVMLAIGLTSVGSVGLAFVFVLKRKHEEDRGRERIA